MTYNDIPIDTKILLESIDECLETKDYEKIYLYNTYYCKMIPSINRSLISEIILSHISKFKN